MEYIVTLTNANKTKFLASTIEHEWSTYGFKTLSRAGSCIDAFFFTITSIIGYILFANKLNLIEFFPSILPVLSLPFIHLSSFLYN